MENNNSVANDFKDYPILVIDDEEDFLAIFERLGDTFNMETARFPSEALKKVEKSKFCVIISDNKMRNAPDMPEDEHAGVNFLRRVREIDEHPLRVLVTGWSKDGIATGMSSRSDINLLIDKLDVITDEEWYDELRRIIRDHVKRH